MTISRAPTPGDPRDPAACQNVPELPPFLKGMTWVDFRKRDPDPLAQLIWGITGQKPGAGPSWPTRAPWLVPDARNPFFTGREDDLRELRRRLRAALLAKLFPAGTHVNTTSFFSAPVAHNLTLRPSAKSASASSAPNGATTSISLRMSAARAADAWVWQDDEADCEEWFRPWRL